MASLDTNLLTGKKYIKDIFSQEQFYNIPEYQRPYVWGLDQIETLLEDVSNAMENDKDKEYFLGCMIWNTRTTKLADIDFTFQDILDGQQRFLTLFLIHTVLRNISTNTTLKTNVQKRLIQEADEFNNIPARNRIEFDIRDDKNFIDKYLIKEQILTEEELLLIVDDENNTHSVRSLANGVKVILHWFKLREISNEDEFQNFVSDFYKYLSNKVLALYLATPNNLDDAYNLFTVLNSRGLQLQVSDILRAQNLREISEDKIRRDYANRWGEFENKINTPYKSFDEFLWSLVFIKMKYRSDDNMTLTKAFEFMFKRGQLQKGIPTFDFVETYIGHFTFITNGSISTKESGNLFTNLNYILANVYGSQYLTPMMHFRQVFGEENIVDFLIRIDNLYSLSWLLGRRQSMTRTFTILKKIDHYKDLITNNHITKTDASAQMVKDVCLDYDYFDESISAEKPLNTEDLRMLLDTERWGSFNGTKVNKTRYVLLKLDLLLSNKNTLLQFNKNSSSIEHLMPQKIEDIHWAMSKEFHKDWVHRLGNLVLIDKNKNSSLSNKPYDVKKFKYMGAYETRANTNYIFSSYQEWNEQTIKLNQLRIVDLLMKYYKGNSIKTYVEIKQHLNGN